MSDVTQETGGNPADAGGAPPMPADSGSSFLSNISANNAESTQEGGAVPNGATAGDQPADTADATLRETMRGPPEGVPEKFWDAEKGQIKTDDLAKGYTNLEKLLSRDKVPVPQGEDDTEGYERWIAAVRPESETAYEFGDPPALPDGIVYDNDLEQSYRNAAFANGLHPNQAKALHEMFVKQTIEQHTQYAKLQQENRTKLTNDLRREYGQQYPAVERRAGGIMDKYADPDFRSYLDESGAGNDPRMIRFLDRIGRDMGGETRLVKNETNAPQAADLDAAIANFTRKNEKALFDKTHPDHRRLVDERDKLFQMRYPEPAA